MTQNELIAELLKQQQAAVPIVAQAAQAAPAARTRRVASGGYGTVLYKAALIVALLLVLGMWFLGGQFTLAALAAWGLPVVSWGLIAWAIPIGITALEVGTLAGRARVPMLWVLWAGVLAFDIASTAIGLLDLAEGRRVLGHLFIAADPTSAAIGGLLGLAIALIPEPTARTLIKELMV